MKITVDKDHVCLDEKIELSPCQSKGKLINKCYDWESWLEHNDQVVSYRLILEGRKKTDGDIYLIVTFTYPVTDESLLASWYLAPGKLIDGEQSKPKGIVTKRLRKWFYDSSGVSLPITGEWGNIDAAYDPWNCAGTIFCNYKAGFENEVEWRRYRKISGF